MSANIVLNVSWHFCLKIPITRFLPCTRSRGWWVDAGEFGRCPFHCFKMTNSASNWANIYCILTIHTSELLTILSRAGAFRIFSLERTSTKSVILHCHCLGRTWLTGAPVIRVEIDVVVTWWIRQETISRSTFKANVWSYFRTEFWNYCSSSIEL
jgi:hypothetical protein